MIDDADALILARYSTPGLRKKVRSTAPTGPSDSDLFVPDQPVVTKHRHAELIALVMHELASAAT